MSTNPFDQQNPFEAPEADGAPYEVSDAGILDVGAAFRDGLEATQAFFGPWLAVSLLGGFLMLLAGLTGIGLFIVVPVLVWGGFRFTLNTIDGGAEFSDLFSGFSIYGAALGGMLGWGIMQFIVGLPGSILPNVAAVMDSDLVVIIAGYLINGAWTLLVMSRFHFAPYYIVDQGLGVIEAFKASWNATAHQKLNTIVFIVVSGVIMVAGFICLIVGLIPAIMIAYSAWASAYRQISGTRAAV